MAYDIPPPAAELIRAWGTHFRSTRHIARDHYGLTALALELGYGNGDRRHAERAIGLALANGRMSRERFERMMYLIHQTSDATWGALKAVFDAEAWGRICCAVNGQRGFRPFVEATAGERLDAVRDELPVARRGRPVTAHKASSHKASARKLAG